MKRLCNENEHCNGKLNSDKCVATGILMLPLSQEQLKIQRYKYSIEIY